MSIPPVLVVPDEPRADPFRPLGRKTERAPLPAQPILHAYYDALFAAHGPQDWWPGRTRFEVIVGTILTQNTSWTNVERAIAGLRKEKLLTVEAMERVSLSKLARLIRSSGYFRQKARKLKEFVGFLRSQHHGSLSKMFQVPTAVLREQLLGVHGIGPETADSILLYAGNHPVFVVDAYTRRILQRHGLARGKETYEDIRKLFEKSLPANRELFNEYHALIVHVGKHFCRAKAPVCSGCALRGHLDEIPEGAR
ncbi:MAG TPA: endonuclease III domain-containing protein [Candidatus Acidoferrum sp.]